VYFPFGAVIEKKPYWLVKADLFSSFKNTVAPIRVSPLEASFTDPLTEKFCA